MTTETVEISDRRNIDTFETTVDLAPDALSQIQKYKPAFLSLSITGLADKAGAKEVDAARKLIKRTRCNVENRLDILNEPHKKAMADNKALKDKIVAELSDIERTLEARHDQWKADIKAEADRQKELLRQRIASRAAALSDRDAVLNPATMIYTQYGTVICTHEDIEQGTDEWFDILLFDVQAAFDAKQAELRAEAERKKRANERLVELSKYGVVMAAGSSDLMQYGAFFCNDLFLRTASGPEYDAVLDAAKRDHAAHEARLAAEAQAKLDAENARKAAEAEAEAQRIENQRLMAEIAALKAAAAPKPDLPFIKASDILTAFRAVPPVQPDAAVVSVSSAPEPDSVAESVAGEPVALPVEPAPPVADTASADRDEDRRLLKKLHSWLLHYPAIGLELRTTPGRDTHKAFETDFAAMIDNLREGIEKL